jgi:hypothetical protein
MHSADDTESTLAGARPRTAALATAFFMLLLAPGVIRAQQGEIRAADTRASVELYGHVMTDAVVDGTGIAGAWLDAARPTRLPTRRDEYGRPGSFAFGVRQTRIGVRPTVPTALGTITGRFEWDLFGVGVDQGQTTFRLRHAYVQVGRVAFGQVESTWMDADVFPDVIDYWGPNGMVFFRNVQVQLRAIDDGRHRLQLSLERPGASPDGGDYAERVELQGVRLRTPLPDVAAHYRYTDARWGHVQVAGIVRRIVWDDLDGDGLDLGGGTVGAGINLCTNVRLHRRAVFRGQVVHGRAVQNYMNDGPADIGVRPGPSVARPFVGDPLRMQSAVAYVDVAWSSRWTSSVGWSTLVTDNATGQAASAFRRGDYASANLLWRLLSRLMVGAELQYLARDPARDAYRADGWRLQFSARHAFSGRFTP